MGPVKSRPGRTRTIPLPMLALLVATVGMAAPPDVGGESLPEVRGPLQRLPVSGRVFGDAYAPMGHSGDSRLRQAQGSVWLDLHPKVNEAVSLQFIPTADWFGRAPSGTVSEGGRFGLREGFLLYKGESGELRAGKQIIPWGKSDLLNPTDFLTAKDFTLFNPDEEVRRVGGTGMMGAWTPSGGDSPWSVTAVWMPVFAKAKPLIPSGKVPSGLMLEDSPESPDVTLGNSEVALKAGLTKEKWDASLLFFRGWNHLPEYRLAPNLRIVPAFHRIMATGADASVTLGGWITRFESSYQWAYRTDALHPSLQTSYWDSVAGVERSFGEYFRSQVQVAWRYYPHFRTPESTVAGSDPATTLLLTQIAKANALLTGAQDPTRTAITFNLSYNNELRGFDAELFYLVNLAHGDYLIRPKTSYLWTETLRTTVGVAYYGGAEDRTLGSMSAFNSVFCEAKYSF